MDINRVIGCTPLEWEYECKYAEHQNGKISDEEWSAYCMDFLEKIMQENKNVLDKLKNV